MAGKEKAPVVKKPTSVKGSCEDLLLKGKTMKQAMSILIKRFPDKEEAVLEKSMKYYASALLKAGKIDQEYRDSLVGKPGRGKTASKVSTDKETKKTTRKSKKAEAEETPAKKTTAKKSRAKKTTKK